MMSRHYTTSADGIDLIKRFEGLDTEAYRCPASVWTIGYGHTSQAGPPEVREGMTITLAAAEALLIDDLRPVEKAVAEAVRVPLGQSQFDALVSIAYNIGVGAMRRSTFISRLNTGDYEGCADAMLWWNKAGGKVLPGLTRRREAERALFWQGHQQAAERYEDDVTLTSMADGHIYSDGDPS